MLAGLPSPPSRTKNVLLFLLLYLSIGAPLALRQNGDWNNVYVPAASRLIAGQDLYPLEHGYLYPPLMALLCIPFVPMPTSASLACYFILNGLALWLILHRARQLCATLIPATKIKRPGLVLALGLTCGLPFAIDALANRQTDLLIAAGLMCGCWELNRGKAGRAVLWLGLAAACKLTPLLFVPYLCWRGRWRAALGLLIVALGVNLLPDLVNPSPTGRLWLAEYGRRYLAPMDDTGRYPGTWGAGIMSNHSLAGVGNRWATTQLGQGNRGPTEVPRPVPLASARFVKMAVYAIDGALLLALFWRLRRRHAPVLEYGAILILMVLFSPHSSKPHLCTMFLPGLVLAQLASATGSRRLWACLIMAILATLAVQKDLIGGPYPILIWFGAVTLVPLVLLAGLAVAFSLVSRPLPTEEEPLLLRWPGAELRLRRGVQLEEDSAHGPSARGENNATSMAGRDLRVGELCDRGRSGSETESPAW